MITILTGDFGSGKTTLLTEQIQKDFREGRTAMLLVPEQETVTAEERMAAILPPAATLSFEVTNFTRLANTVFRRVGGLSYRYAGSATRTLCMWRTMGELLPLLHEKGGEVEIGRVRKMTAAMGELSALSLSPAALSAAAKKLDKGSRLAEKLEDLALLSTTYHAILSEGFDDATEDLDRLAALLTEGDPLPDTVFYLDGFISYTEQEYRVLAALAARHDITLTLTLPEPREDALPFAETRETFSRLIRLADRAGVRLVRRDLGENKRAASPFLRDIGKLLFSENMMGGVCSEAGFPAMPADTDPRRAPLRILRAKDPYAEAEWIAADIARRVAEEGARYRDFAVIARRTEDYAGILDVVFEDAEIPAFMAKRTDLSAFRAVKLIYTAYAVIASGWRRGDVISFLKCGMSDVSEEDADVFELYATRWKLDGRRFYDDVPWNMNPDGYKATLTARGEDILLRANAVRERLRAALLPFSAHCRTQSVREHCRALFSFLSALSVEEKLVREAEEAARDGRAAEAAELSRLFRVIGDTLDMLAEAIPDTVVSPDNFLDLLRLSFGEVSLAGIPTALDEVTVGSADLLRVHEPKHVYLIGVEDGVFPAAVESASIFSEQDRAILSGLGLTISPALLLQAARELFCFLRAFSLPRESVTLLYAEATLGGGARRPADVITQLTEGENAPLSVTDIAKLPPLDRLWRRQNASLQLGILSGSPAGEALASYFADDPVYALTVARLRRPLTEADCRISQMTTARLYPGDLRLSQSKIDTYVKCPFSYVCKNVLALDPNRVIDFDFSDIGTLMHAVIERFFHTWGERPADFSAMTEEARHAEVDRITREHLLSLFPDGALGVPRIKRLLRILAREAYLLIDELSEELMQSLFRPRFFEMNMSSTAEDAPGVRRIPLSDGTAVTIAGFIDRVDVYRDDEGRAYLRVIDYKTGDERFSAENVERGLGIQLLLYLVSLWKSENPRFRALLDAKEILPGGMIYVGARMAEKVFDRPTDEETAKKAALTGVYRRGLCLDDEKVLFAMDTKKSGRFLPVRLNKDGSLRKGEEEKLFDLDRIGDLSDKMDAAIRRIGEDMKSGNAAASPMATGKRHPCEYCEMKAVCRSATM